MSKNTSPDLIVIGAGIFGLWQARHALKRGERVLVLEKRQVGAGASGGFLGALMPHMPDNWNAKKQMQFDGLSTLADVIAELENDTGLDCGYRRCGRLMPLKHEKMLGHLEARIEGAKANWLDSNGKSFAMMAHVSPEDLAKRFVGPSGHPWLSPEVAKLGAQYDTLSARVNPRAYIAALAKFIREHDKGELCEGSDVVNVQSTGDGVLVTLGDGEKLAAGRAMIANGWEAYELLERMDARKGTQKLTGRGVKGQAVLLEHKHDDDLPILYDDGSYVIPHGIGMGAGMDKAPNRIAVGATSVNDWLGESDATGCDPELQRTGYDEAAVGYFNHAKAMCPTIENPTVVERWANIRPRNTVPDPETGKIGTEPIFKPIDDEDRISVAVGGFKISFGIGHL